MSSLMQFNGQIDRRGVHLRACRVYIPAEWSDQYPDCVYKSESTGKAAEFYTSPCPICAKHHEAVYTFARKPAGMFGCWIVFRYNGEEHVPDLSVPISLKRMPRDAKLLPIEQAARYWHS